MGFGQGLGCSGSCAKIILFVVNFFIFLCGAALLGVGLAIFLGADAFDWLENITTDNALDDPLLEIAIYTMMAVGGLLFLVGFFGCCGACQESKCMLMTYAVFVIILLIAQITGAILAIIYRSEFGDGVEESMADSVQNDYGLDGNDATTKAWDEMQIDWKCCGSSDYRDYNGSSYQQQQQNETIPESCCTDAKMEDGEVNIDTDDYTQCQDSAVMGNGQHYHTTGCYEKLEEWVDENTLIIICVLFGLALVQCFGALLACCIESRITHSNNYA